MAAGLVLPGGGPAVEAVEAVEAGRVSAEWSAAVVSPDWAATPAAAGSADRGGSPVTAPAGAPWGGAAGCRSHLRMYCSAGESQVNQSSSPAANE
ncbi:MAG: hypothetical protein WBO08_13950 [Mycobacterium sp.]